MQWMTDVRETIPLSMQEMIRSDWQAKEGLGAQELDVTCKGIAATFFVDPGTHRCKIRTQDGREITPNEFEQECGSGNAKAWLQSIVARGTATEG